MNTHFYLTLSIVIVLLFTNCKKQNIESVSNNNINPEQMSVGQKSRYILWNSDNFEKDTDTTFKQVSDTLTLTTIGEIEGTYWVEEECTNEPFSRFSYKVKLRNDTLSFSKGQDGFVMNVPKSILLESAPTYYFLNTTNPPQWTTNRWGKPTISASNQKFGTLKSVKIMGKTYNDVFVYYNSQFVDRYIPNTVVIYSKKEGIISVQYYSNFSKFALQYNLLPE
jgi:hypothetical protein